MEFERKTFEIRLGIYASEAQAQGLVDQIRLMLCPDPDHHSPCPIPWAIGILSETEHPDAVQYPGLKEQYRVEHPNDQ
ncbi:hypothetical protein [Amycolatopsis circi]|uniref:hypothetical protein n=1 Tax=Amycolatopsis circi TaxID=871959 RepID=UPI000E26EDD4|nr:hypothetical protein [Amycolatopsis circi]